MGWYPIKSDVECVFFKTYSGCHHDPGKPHERRPLLWSSLLKLEPRWTMPEGLETRQNDSDIVGFKLGCSGWTGQTSDMEKSEASTTI